MSTYATIRGRIEFKRKKSYNTSVKILTNGGWVKDGKWLDEGGGVIADFDTSEPSIIIIPQACYRNLIHVLDDLVSCAIAWTIVYACTDGVFSGGVLSSGGDYTIDLDDWAGVNFKDPAPSDDDEFTAWQNEVVEQFLGNPGV